MMLINLIVPLNHSYCKYHDVCVHFQHVQFYFDLVVCQYSFNFINTDGPFK